MSLFVAVILDNLELTEEAKKVNQLILNTSELSNDVQIIFWSQYVGKYEINILTDKTTET